MIEKTVIGFRDGNWKPLILKLESIALGVDAGAAVAALFAVFSPGFAASAIGIVVAGVAITTIASLLNVDNVEEINAFISDQLDTALKD